MLQQLLTPSLVASSLYPIIASFNAYDSYAKVATKTGATTFLIGGVSIPLGTMLKRATTNEASIEEDTLNYRLLTVQMWMIYWIVNGCVRVAESVLLLKYLPLYSMARLCFSLWLIAPIVLSSTRLKQSQVLSFGDMQSEWVKFSSQGCGMVYFQYLKPLMEGQLAYLNSLSLEPILAAVSRLVPFTLMVVSESSGKYGELLGGYGKAFFSREAPKANTDADLADYDVVDSVADSQAKDVKAKAPESPAQDAKPEARATGRLWFW